MQTELATSDPFMAAVHWLVRAIEVTGISVFVLIRTFLSFALEVEINGHWPWREHERRRGGAAGEDPPAL